MFRGAETTFEKIARKGVPQVRKDFDTPLK